MAKGPAANEATGTSRWEWAIAAAGAVLVVSAVAYMVWYGFDRPRGSPDMVIRQISTLRQGESYLVQVEVKNSGHVTGVNVDISGALMDGEREVEESSATIDYVPQQSMRQAYFAFTRDPAEYELKLRVKGMAKP